MKHPKKLPLRLLLDVAILSGGVALLYGAAHWGLGAGPLSPGPGTIMGGLYVAYVGALFLLSFHHHRACHLSMLIGAACAKVSREGDRQLARAYAAAFLAIGSGLLLIGLGLL